MNNWTIRKRIVLGFGLVLLLVAAQTAFSFSSLRRAQRASAQVADQAVPGTALAAQVARRIADAQIAVLRALAAATPEERHNHRAEIDDSVQRSVRGVTLSEQVASGLTEIVRYASPPRRSAPPRDGPRVQRTAAAPATSSSK